MCPSHITHKWAREVLLTIPRARAFLVEDMRNGGDPKKQHGICEVKLSKGRTVYEGKHLTLAEMRRMGRREWRKRFSGPVFFIIGKDKGKLGYFWDHAYLKAKSGPNLGSIVNPDSGLAILDSERQKLIHLDFDDKVKMSETLASPKLGTTRFSLRCGRPTGPAFSGWRRSSTSAVTCVDGSISRLRTNSTNSRATPPKATASVSWDAPRSG